MWGEDKELHIQETNTASNYGCKGAKKEKYMQTEGQKLANNYKLGENKQTKKKKGDTCTRPDSYLQLI